MSARTWGHPSVGAVLEHSTQLCRVTASPMDLEGELGRAEDEGCHTIRKRVSREEGHGLRSHAFRVAGQLNVLNVLPTEGSLLILPTPDGQRDNTSSCFYDLLFGEGPSVLTKTYLFRKEMMDRRVTFAPATRRILRSACSRRFTFSSTDTMNGSTSPRVRWPPVPVTGGPMWH